MLPELVDEQLALPPAQFFPVVEEYVQDEGVGLCSTERSHIEVSGLQGLFI
jgi:hypothetical protein